VQVYRDPSRAGKAYVLFGMTPEREEILFDTAKVAPMSDMGSERAGMVMNEEAATALMESLWDAGIRPSQIVGSTATEKAKDKHLEDMRRLAFRALKIDAP
jgi:hypothetical protein